MRCSDEVKSETLLRRDKVAFKLSANRWFLKEKGTKTENSEDRIRTNRIGTRSLMNGLTT